MKSRAARTRGRRSARSVPMMIAGLTVAGVVAALVVANLAPKGGSPDSGPANEAAADSHDAARTANGADIHFGTTEVDLGTIPVGKEVGYAFSYANIGNQTLQIEDVQVRVLEGC